MDAPRFTLICCSVDPAAAEALRRNVAATIGEPFEFDVKSKKLAVTLCPHLIFQTFQIRIFHHTDNLNPFFCKMFKIACQLQSRTVDFRRNDHSF